MDMRCYNSLCLYWRNGCILEEIYLDQEGRCAYCVPVRLDAQQLQAAKEKMLRPPEG